MKILQVALPFPKRALFDYLNIADGSACIGGRVIVPFGNRRLVGVVVAINENSEVAENKLKPIQKVIDNVPIFSATLLKWLTWASRYYHHSLGDILHAALPAKLRKDQSATITLPKTWGLTAVGKQFDVKTLNANAHQQKHIILQLQTGNCDNDAPLASYKTLANKGLIEQLEIPLPSIEHWPEEVSGKQALKPSVEQGIAISMLTQQQQFQCTLLDGITGSGKTEVYLQSILPHLKSGKQILVLVPEIGLTPQTVSRFETRFGVAVGSLHSGMTDEQRFDVWYRAKHGHLAIVIGTRSAIFTPFKRLGMIIIDEEHDSSFKQQDGFRYHGRDLAVMRAKLENIPLVMGSATPSLESLHNVAQKKFQYLQLTHRAGTANTAAFKLHDIRNQPLSFGLSPVALAQIEQQLTAGNQVMVFINRRGYAPSLVCHQCGHNEMCESCDVPMTVHLTQPALQCHQCGARRAISPVCRACGSSDIHYQGVGTEQVEQGLQGLFKDYSCVRIDSDSVRSKRQFDTLLDDIRQHRHQILIGTQILAKGHHFPDVTLVVIVNVDSALFSADFRAHEHLAQLITQVAGRAGRAHKPGQVWLQTHQPEHPLLNELIANGYHPFAQTLLIERQAANLPPSQHQGLFKVEHQYQEKCLQFLNSIKTHLSPHNCRIIGPLPCLIEKRQSRVRFMLLLQSPNRQSLHQCLGRVLPTIENLPLASSVRWSLDIDPHDFN